MGLGASVTELFKGLEGLIVCAHLLAAIAQMIVCCRKWQLPQRVTEPQEVTKLSR
jgi:hypothetical protein